MWHLLIYFLSIVHRYELSIKSSRINEREHTPTRMSSASGRHYGFPVCTWKFAGCPSAWRTFEKSVLSCRGRSDRSAINADELETCQFRRRGVNQDVEGCTHSHLASTLDHELSWWTRRRRAGRISGRIKATRQASAGPIPRARLSWSKSDPVFHFNRLISNCLRLLIKRPRPSTVKSSWGDSGKPLNCV